MENVNKITEEIVQAAKTNRFTSIAEKEVIVVVMFDSLAEALKNMTTLEPYQEALALNQFKYNYKGIVK